MYHSVVRSQVQAAFAELSRGKNSNLSRILGKFHPAVHFSFSGDHALGGHHQGVAAVERWFQRLYRIFPDIRFQVQRMVVSGWPWNTVVTTFFQVQAPLPDGTLYQNEGVQVVRLQWGKITEDHLFEDVHKLLGALGHLEAAGLREAGAPPLSA